MVTAPPLDPDPKSWGDKYKEWIALVTTVAGPIITVAVTLVTLFAGAPSDSAQLWIKVAGFSVAAVTVGGGWLWWRSLKKRRPAEKAGQVEGRAGAPKTTAIRGPFSFGVTDELPGVRRRTEADTLCTQVLSRRFSFWVVTGETGCGKSSLLDAGVRRRLYDQQIPVEFISSPRSLYGRSVGSRGELHRDLESIRERVAARAKAAGPDAQLLVLIVDQFEEFLIDYPDTPQREELGRELAALMKSAPPVTVLCGVRKDYLPDLLELSRAIPEPLRTATTTYLKNFTEDEAAEVIRECATKDGVTLDADFADKVAHDLASRNAVRPPDLQIVCAALRGKLTLTNYARAGGATGILSEYVRKALDGCRDGTLARRLLLELCDFRQRAKQKPLTFEELRDRLSSSSAAPDPSLEAKLRQALAHLAEAWLLSRESEDKKELFALAQDYLVDAIALATRDVSSRAEEAEQVVNYYLGEFKLQPRKWAWFRPPVVPWSKLAFISENAERSVLERTEVAELIATNRRQHYARLAAKLAAVGAATLVCATALTFERSWQLREVGHHFQDGRHGHVTFLQAIRRGEEDIILTRSEEQMPSSDFPLTGGGYFDASFNELVSLQLNPRLMPSPYSFWALTWAPNTSTAPSLPPKTYLRLWKASDASQVACTSGRFLPTDFDDFFLQYRVETGGPRLARRSLDDLQRTVQTKLPPLEGMSDHRLGIVNNDQVVYRLPTGDGQGELHVYSLSQDKELGVLQKLPYAAQIKTAFLDARRAVVTVEQYRSDGDSPGGLDQKLLFWEFGKKEVELYTSRHRERFSVAADPVSRRFALLVVGSAKDQPRGDGPPGSATPKATLRYYSADDLEHPRTVALQPPARYDEAQLMVAPGGDFILLSRFQGDQELAYEVRSAVDLEPASHFSRGLDTPTNSLRLVPTRTALWMVWGKDTDTKVWNLKANVDPITLKGLDLNQPGKTLLMDGNGRRVLGIEGNQVELWDTKVPERSLARHTIPGGIYNVGFTLDDGAFYVGTEGGGLTFFKAEDGKLLAELTGIGGSLYLARFVPEAQRINIWTSEGRVLRYEYMWNVWFTRWFRSPKNSYNPCPGDEPVEP